MYNRPHNIDAIWISRSKSFGQKSQQYLILSILPRPTCCYTFSYCRLGLHSFIYCISIVSLETALKFFNPMRKYSCHVFNSRGSIKNSRLHRVAMAYSGVYPDAGCVVALVTDARCRAAPRWKHHPLKFQLRRAALSVQIDRETRRAHVRPRKRLSMESHSSAISAVP